MKNMQQQQFDAMRRQQQFTNAQRDQITQQQAYMQKQQADWQSKQQTLGAMGANSTQSYSSPSRLVSFVNRLLAVVVALGFLIFFGLVIALLMNVAG